MKLFRITVSSGGEIVAKLEIVAHSEAQALIEAGRKIGLGVLIGEVFVECISASGSYK